jgi:hypothetical protein
MGHHGPNPEVGQNEVMQPYIRSRPSASVANDNLMRMYLHRRRSLRGMLKNRDVPEVCNQYRAILKPTIDRYAGK